MIDRIVSITMVAETLRIAVPYAAAAAAGVWAERSGVIHIGLEGVLLVSAFASVAAAHATGSPWFGLFVGIVTGALYSSLHATLTERARVHAVVSGIALNLFAAAATRLLLRGLYDSASNSPGIEAFGVGPTGTSGFNLLGRVLLDPVFLLGGVCIALTPWLLARSRFGLRLRACGENPEAAASSGLSVARTRIKALAVSGAICALGGVHLAFDQHRFESGMSAGRGFIALAAVVISGWRAGWALVACLAFGFLEALQISLQDELGESPIAILMQALPYLATLIILGVAAGRSRAPRGLGTSVDTAR